MAYIPNCHVCGIPINKKIDDWVKPGKWYFHRQCYKDWILADFDPDDRQRYEEVIFDFIGNQMHFKYDRQDYFKCCAQITKLLKKGRSLKGILLTLKYYYEIKKGKWIPGYGIGIVDYVYEDAAKYWYYKNKREAGIVEKIEKQMKEAAAERVVTIAAKPKKEIEPISFDFLSEEDNGEG